MGEPSDRCRPLVGRGGLPQLRSCRKGERAARETKGRLAEHLLPVLGEQPLAELTTAEVTAWRNGMVKSRTDEDAIRKSRDSANRVLAMAKAAFNLAFNTGLVADDRAWRGVKAFKGVGKARKVILSEAELQRRQSAAVQRDPAQPAPRPPPATRSPQDRSETSAPHSALAASGSSSYASAIVALSIVGLSTTVVALTTSTPPVLPQFRRNFCHSSPSRRYGDPIPISSERGMLASAGFTAR